MMPDGEVDRKSDFYDDTVVGVFTGSQSTNGTLFRVPFVRSNRVRILLGTPMGI